MSDAMKLALARGALLVALLIAWELFGRLVDSTWTSQPSDVAAQIATWAADGLAWHIAVTLTEMVIGLAIGVPGGILLGLWLGRSPRIAGLLYPFIVVLNSVPVVALAPLLIMWFGLGMQPKIALVALVSFLLLFFNTFAGAQAVDRDLIDGVILLPDNLFYNTTAAGKIVVLSKRKPAARKDRIVLLNPTRRVA